MIKRPPDKGRVRVRRVSQRNTLGQSAVLNSTINRKARAKGSTGGKLKPQTLTRNCPLLGTGGGAHLLASSGRRAFEYEIRRKKGWTSQTVGRKS